MKIAVAYKNGRISQDFRETNLFKLYQTDGREILWTEITQKTSGRESRDLICESKADALVCGWIGQTDKEILLHCGVTVYDGMCGSTDKAAEELLRDLRN